MKNTFSTFILILSTLMIIGCEKDNPIKGCTDSKSLNYSATAEEDDGTCDYSNVTFFASAGYYSGVPITQIDVIVNGEIQGVISSVYPSGPGNCSAIGTVNYQLQDGNPVDWNTVVHLLNGNFIYDSGTVIANRSLPCIKVNVTQ